MNYGAEALCSAHTTKISWFSIHTAQPPRRNIHPPCRQRRHTLGYFIKYFVEQKGMIKLFVAHFHPHLPAKPTSANRNLYRVDVDGVYLIYDISEAQEALVCPR